MVCLDPVSFGRQRLTTRTGVRRHRHEGSYLALMIDGSYEEAGDRGRHHVTAGDVVMHGGFEAHLNRYDRSHSEVLNIALPTWMEPDYAVMQIADPDMAVRLAERDPREAAAFLFYGMKPGQLRLADWPDELAAALVADPNLRLQEWARLHHVIARYAEDKEGSFASRTEGGNIGTDVLARFTLDFDYAHELIWFEPVPGYTPRPFPRSGLSFYKESATSVVIVNTIAGGPADKAGLKEGDALLTVAGEKATALSREELVKHFQQPVGTKVPVTYSRKGMRRRR